MRTIDLQLLRTFRTVATSGSMTKTSGLLNLTQGAVSQQVRKLEEQLGCRLLFRSKTGMTLTQEGEKLFSRSQTLLNLNDQIWQEMTEPEFAGRLSLGIPLDLVNGQLPLILRHFAEAFPDIDINLVCAPTLELKRQFNDGVLDLTLMEEVQADISGETLYSDQLVWISAKGSRLLETTPLPLSIASTDCVFRKPTTDALDRAGRPWKRVYESNNIDAVQAMIRMDLAVGVYLKQLVPDSLNHFQGGDRFPALPEFFVTLAVSNGKQQDLARHLAEYIKRGFAPQKAA
ncbi:LysR family transcriptional regulator [Sneathiella aquimaris]|uniref:LysR family transcriptional regulator n=1 Tax=Sneathiella aquimaris TaxID=2599305 RepID=UPI00146C5880|nr:LysR family transcriptional regulator [Sneathiella aquimaris]